LLRYYPLLLAMYLNASGTYNHRYNIN
jgi:hypothetical protein